MRIELNIRTLLLRFPRLRLHACARDGMRIKWLVGRVWGGSLDWRVHEGRVERHLDELLFSSEASADTGVLRLWKIRNVEVVEKC